MKELKLCLVLLSAILLNACGGDNGPSSEPSKPTPTPTPTTTTPTIEIATTENTSPVLSQTSGSAQLSFKASGDWTVTCSESWIKVSQASGKAGSVTITISASDNDTYDDRKGTVTISIGSVIKTINVSQVQKDAIVLALQDYNIEATTKQLDFEVETNVSLAVTISEDASSWITQATTRALHTATLHFDIAPNTTTEAREGTITISGGSVTQTIKVKQDGDGVISFEDAEVKAICVANWDTNGDGELSHSEAAAVTDIGTTFKGNVNVRSFNEFQFFKGLTDLPLGAFRDCSDLTGITLPDGITSIGGWAFFYCSSLTNITLPEGLKTIGDSAFVGCSSLTSIKLPDGLTSIEIFAFQNCSSLTNITIPKGVTSIGGQTFGSCSSLISVTLPDGITSIGESAFYNCSNLTSIKLPDELITIGRLAFSGCSSLASITLPTVLSTIESSAFGGCSSLTSITLPEGVTTIGEWVFGGCTSLTSIILPDGVNKIGDCAFANCSSLTSISLSDGLTSIGESGFSGCSSLTSITLPGGVTSIGPNAFNNCSSLTHISCLATTPPTLYEDAVNNTNSCPIYVPAGSVDAYKAADGWKDYADRIQAIPE